MADELEDEIGNLFRAAIEHFPPEFQEKAEDWLASRDAAHRIVTQLIEKGVVSLFEDDPKPPAIG